MDSQIQNISRIDSVPNPEHQAILDKIGQAENEAHRLASNKNDFRNLLRYSLADTEDFLRATSKDPCYDRSGPPKQYYQEGGWL